ncbi:MAG: SRPBCC family protein [Thermoplasmata archaeon]|nr:SRPBCC family protein [Thermoplasmata archaeon]
MVEGANDAGTVVGRGDHATLEFRRHLPYPPEVVWKALTDPPELAIWYLAQGTIDGRVGGTIELVAGPSRLRVTGRILAWEPPRLFEHEWKVAPRSELPGGEDATIRWELHPEGTGTRLELTHRNLRRPTALGFAPGTHAFLDRLAAHLAGVPLPNWQQRYTQVAPQYPPAWGVR